MHVAARAIELGGILVVADVATAGRLKREARVLALGSVTGDAGEAGVGFFPPAFEYAILSNTSGSIR